jgi:hypothetical protein
MKTLAFIVGNWRSPGFCQFNGGDSSLEFVQGSVAVPGIFGQAFVGIVSKLMFV